LAQYQHLPEAEVAVPEVIQPHYAQVKLAVQVAVVVMLMVLAALALLGKGVMVATQTQVLTAALAVAVLLLRAAMLVAARVQPGVQVRLLRLQALL
jgi:hypothetical protein